MGLVPDKELTGYVSSIGNRLVDALDENPFEFHFYVADDPIPNAFALPGGYVYVTRGILSLVTKEDELACVIHVIRRHSVRQMRSSIIPNLLELPGSIVGTVVDDDLGDLLNTPIHTSNSLLLASYSRKHETESDTRGIELASKAGYDPNAMAAILERLSTAVEVISNEQEKKSYFDDHPYTPDRVKKITKTTSTLSWEEKAKISEDFPAPLDGMVFGYHPGKGLFKEEVFLHPDLQKSARILRPLTSAERKAIEVRKIRIVRANKKETLEDLSKRTNNVVDAYITSIMNGIDENAKLDKDQALKIVVREKYLQ